MDGEWAREEWEEMKDSSGTETQKAERGGLQGEEAGAGTEAAQAWLFLFAPVTLS